MSKSAAARRKSSVSPARERSKSLSPAPPTRTATASGKPGVMVFQSKGARNDMELAFDRFCALDKTSPSDAVAGRGLTQFLSEMAVTPGSLESFVLFWKLGATQRDCITRSEWVIATYMHGVESIAQLRQKMTDWTKDVRDHGGSFLLMYNFSYDYVRGEEDRCMSLANAVRAWELLFGKKELYPKWKTWVVENVPSDVSRDLWRQVGIFFVSDASAQLSSSAANTATASTALPSVLSGFLVASGKAA